jgi:plasmid stabilization system protein ParE
VTVATQAQEDVQQIHDLIARDKKKAAAKWVRSFHRLARSLAYLPHRYEVVPEAADIERPWREIIFGNYRIFYRIDAKRVTVERVVHAARLLDRSFFKPAPEDIAES